MAARRGARRLLSDVAGAPHRSWLAVWEAAYVGLFTIEGYGVPVGFRPLPVRPTFTVWGPDVVLDGGCWVDMWDLAYDSRPGAERLAGNPLRRVDLRHGKDQTGDRRFVAVTTIPRVPATAAPTNRQGGSPTSLVDAAGAAEARIVHVAGDVAESDNALMDPDGRWEDGNIDVVGTKWPARVRRLGDYWLAVVELDAVYVGLVAFNVLAHEVSISTREVIPWSLETSQIEGGAPFG